MSLRSVWTASAHPSDGFARFVRSVASEPVPDWSISKNPTERKRGALSEFTCARFMRWRSARIAAFISSNDA